MENKKRLIAQMNNLEQEKASLQEERNRKVSDIANVKKGIKSIEKGIEEINKKIQKCDSEISQVQSDMRSNHYEIETANKDIKICQEQYIKVLKSLDCKKEDLMKIKKDFLNNESHKYQLEQETPKIEGELKQIKNRMKNNSIIINSESHHVRQLKMKQQQIENVQIKHTNNVRNTRHG
jgi:chromosome segregation ATPase